MIHDLTIDINNIIMGITNKGSNTIYPRTKNNYLWCHTSKGSNLAPDDDDFLTPSLPGREQMVHI